MIILSLAAAWQPGSAASPAPWEADWIVSPNGDLRTISESLDKASSGDTILVEQGNYKESLVIEKSVILIGENWPVIDGGDQGTVVILKANGIQLKGFDIRGSGVEPDRDHAGVTLEAADITVENNHLSDVLFGIFIAQADRAIIRGNDITSKEVYDLARKGDGIRIWNSKNVLIEGNIVHQARDVVSWYANGVTFRNNEIIDGRYGIHLMYCDQTEISGNRLRNNSVGIYTMYSKNVIMEYNDIRQQRGPSGYALGFKDATDVTVNENLLVDNRAGIYMDNTPYGLNSYARFTNNIFAFNDIGVQMLSFVKDAEFTNNTFWENVQQVALQGAGKVGQNAWKNNYWSDYTGYDANNDGTGDIAYRSERFFEDLTNQEPLLRALQFSPAVQAMEFAATSFPIIKPQPKLEDPQPNVLPATIPASAFTSDNGQTARRLMIVGFIFIFLGISGSIASRYEGKNILRKNQRSKNINDPSLVNSETEQLLVQIYGLTKRYGKAVVLKDFSLEILAGETVALWGENGAGKTTLLKAMLGLIDSDGKINIAGLDIRKHGKQSRSKIGYVPQEAIFYDMSVKATLNFYAKIKKVETGRISTLAEKLGLSSHLEKPVPALSGGLKQRLALAVALLADPPILLLDEPTANLDAQARIDYLSLLTDLRKEGKTIIFASHRIDEAEMLADRVIILEQGIKVGELTPGEVRLRLHPDVVLTLWVGEGQRQAAMESLVNQGWQAHINGRGTVVVDLASGQKMQAMQFLFDHGFTIRDFEVEGANTAWN